MREDIVLELLRNTKPLPGKTLRIKGATRQEIEEFELIHSLILPPELKAWFFKANGADVNPGGLNGLFSNEPAGSLDWYFRKFPAWKKNGWYPLGTDGCGDLYILNASITIESTRTHPVCFMDQSNFGTLSYAVASGCWIFLEMLLENEVLHADGKAAYWPFDRDVVLAKDPDLANCKGIPLPWEVTE